MYTITMSDPIITLALLGGAGYIAYAAFNSAQHKKYDATIVFTVDMMTNKKKNEQYWNNRVLDPSYKVGEAIRYSPDAIMRGIGQSLPKDPYIHTRSGQY